MHGISAILLAAIGGAAAAQTTAIYGGSPSRIDLSLPVTASIQGGCGFSGSPSGTANVGEITAGFSHVFAFATQCGTAFRVAVTSASGGLLTPVAPGPGQSSLAPYEVTLSLAGDPGVTAVSAMCDAASLQLGASPACGFRGPAAAATGLRVNGGSGGIGSSVRVAAPPYASGLLTASTDYQDTLTLTISASP